MRRAFLAPLIATSMLWACRAVEACPLCKDALTASGGEGAARAAKGFAVSIATMASMPFLLAGTVAFLLVRASRRSKAR